MLQRMVCVEEDDDLREQCFTRLWVGRFDESLRSRHGRLMIMNHNYQTMDLQYMQQRDAPSAFVTDEEQRSAEGTAQHSLWRVGCRVGLRASLSGKESRRRGEERKEQSCPCRSCLVRLSILK